MKLPKEFKKFAAPLAAKNPSAFADAAAAENSLFETYKALKEDDDLMASSIGGYMMRKDGEGYIDMYVIATLALDVDGAWWAE